jgi:hypothetical protein
MKRFYTYLVRFVRLFRRRPKSFILKDNGAHGFTEGMDVEFTTSVKMGRKLRGF